MSFFVRLFSSFLQAATVPNQEFDSIVGSLPFDFELSLDPPIAPPPPSSTLDTASAANAEVDRVLQHFFAELKKQDGTDYEPDSLRTMLGALDRHFRNAGHEFRIIKDTICRVQAGAEWKGH